MFIKNLMWLWQVSLPVCVEEAVGVAQSWLKALHIQKRRISFTVSALRLSDLLQPYRQPRPGSPFQRALKQRPEILGVVLWPYICKTWCTRTKLRRIEEHYKVLESIEPFFDFPKDKALLLLNLEELVPSLRVVIDQPKWFMREGMLVLNLFAGDVRIYSLAFSFALESGRVVTYIGAIQGVDTEGILEEYKSLTKALHGMRPRDFLLEVFRTLCRCAGVHRIYAVEDAKRQHRSAYYQGAAKSLFCDYNSIWLDRGGVKHDEDFFIFSLETPMKNLDEVASKKRAMFRRRYELLHSIEERMKGIVSNARVQNVIPVPGKPERSDASKWLHSPACFDVGFLLTVASNI